MEPFNSSPVLFTVEEAFMRVGQSKGSGCLLVFNAQESLHIFVENGAVISVKGGEKDEEKALTHALALDKPSYRWIPDAEPPERSVNIQIQDYVAQNSQSREKRFGKTIKMPSIQRAEKKLDFEYFFIPEDAATSKLRVKRASTVVGREPTCDLYIQNFQVSRRHCLLEITDRGLLVKDLESTNGTFVNGIPMKDGYINEGDRLSLGTYALTLRKEKI